MDKDKVGQLVKMCIQAFKTLGVRSVIIGIEGLDSDDDPVSGAFIDCGSPLDALAAMVQQLNMGIISTLGEKLSEQDLKKFASLMGARIVHSEEEMRRLVGMEPDSGESQGFGAVNTSYRSKIVH